MNYYAPFYTPTTNYTPNVQNGFMGQNYTPYANQSQNFTQPNVAQIPQNDSTMIWVLGKNEAESYPVAPNCQVVLWDKNAPTLYVKSVTANGIPNMRILDFAERKETAQNAPVNDEKALNAKFVGIDDFNALRSEFEELRTKYDDLIQRSEEKTNTKAKSGIQKVKDGEQ